MTTVSTIEIDQREAMRHATLQVRVTGRARARICVWIAVRLLYAASRVLGTKVSIDVELQG